MKKILLILIVSSIVSFHYLLAQEQSSENLDSIYSLVKSSKTDSNKVNKLLNLASKLQFDNPQKALAIATEAQNISKIISWKMGEGYSFNQMGIINGIMSNYSTALNYFNQALALYKEIKNRIGISNVLGNIGIIYMNQSNFAKALEFYFEALKIDEEIGNKEAVGKHLSNIGIIYYNQGEFKKALDHYFKALKMAENSGKVNKTSNILGNISIVYIDMGELDKALEYSHRALKLAENTKNKNAIGTHLGNLGNIYYKQQKYSEALEHYFKALKINKELENKTNIVANLGNIGAVYYDLSEDTNFAKIDKKSKLIGHSKKENLQTSIAYSKEAVDIAQLIGEKRLVLSYSLVLYQAYEKLEQYAEALKYYKIWQTNKDSIFNEENTRKVEQLESKREVDIKEMKIIEQQKQITYYTAITIFVIIILIIITVLYFHKKKTTEQVEEKNRIITEINASKDRFFSIIAHDLKSPFSGFLGLTKMMAERIQDMTMREMQDLAKSMQSSANNLYKLLENLLEWSRMQRGVTGFNPESVSLLFIVNQNIEVLGEFAKQKDIAIINNIQDGLNITADVPMLNTIIRNLLSNAVKFTPHNGEIEIGAVVQTSEGSEPLEGFNRIYIKDSGIGMSPEIIEKLFRIDEKVSRPGTDNEPSTGLGLLLCKEFIEKHGGKIWVESEVGKESTFFFTLK